MKQKLVFTNGCFDILHAGHVKLLEYCSTLGERVIVGLNSDESITCIKGKERPINNEKDRLFVLQSIKYVDEVHIFNEKTPINLIKKLKPDIIVKGGDYKKEDVVGFELVQQVNIFGYIDGHSTTQKIKNIINR